MSDPNGDRLWKLTTRPADEASQSGDRQVLVRSSDFHYDVATGRANGDLLVLKFGRNPDVTTAGAPEDVWNGGGVYTGFPTTSGELVTVVSSDSNDTNSSGSGARTVRLSGLDENWQIQTETVALNGTNAVDSVNTWTRVNRCQVLTSGSNNQAFAAGTITVAHKDTPANVFVSMPSAYNQSTIGCYTVPVGYTGYIKSFNIEVNRNNTAIVEGGIWIRTIGTSPRIIRPFSASDDVSHTDVVVGGLEIAAKTDIAVRLLTASATCKVTTNIDILLKAD